MSSMMRASHRSIPLDEEILESRKFVTQNTDINWVYEPGPWMCDKQLIHYSAFSSKETSIDVNEFVCILGVGAKNYIAHVEDLFEDQHGQKVAKVRWFLRAEEVRDQLPRLKPHSREVFITYTIQEISAKCIYRRVAVLTPNHFRKCKEVLSEEMFAECFECHREIKSNSVSSFLVSKLCGYSGQPILFGTIKSDDVVQNRIEYAEASAPQGPEASDRNKTVEHSLDFQSVPRGPQRRGLKINEFGRNNIRKKAVLETVPEDGVLLNSNENIELLSQDSGIRGCWFRCKVLHSCQKNLKVQYFDVDDAVGSGKLEEWVPARREAAPDRLGMRSAGRLRVRPCPHWNPSSVRYEVGMAVEVWWCDGWWEGVVIEYNTSSQDTLQIYLPGENKSISAERKHIRISRDWVDNHWVNVRSKPDILSYLSSLNANSAAAP